VINLGLTLLIFAILLVVDYLAITARAAYTQTNHARLLLLRDQMGERVNSTSVLLHYLPRIRASLNLVLLLVRFLAAGLCLNLALQLLPETSLWVLVVGLILGAFLWFWFEWAVESNVSKSPETWALRLNPLVKSLMWLLAILVWLPLTASGEAQNGAVEFTSNVTEDELKTLVDAGQEEGVFQQGERRMIYSIFQLGDTLAREIMVPRIDMLALDVTTPLNNAVRALLKSGHSRVPVFEESVDNMLGLLYAKDLLRVWQEGSQLESLRDLLRPAYFVPEAKKADELLAEMQSQRIHMAVVVDEYGGVAGLVTLEDIVEEILGEIRDEYDQAEESPYLLDKNGDYVFQGRVDLDDFNEILGSQLPKDEADTIGGFIYSRLGRVPDVGDQVEDSRLLLVVDQVSGRRIRKVRARWLPLESIDHEEIYENNGRDPQ
jgi:magnesium and cobalt exporter, CNNM family